MGQTNKGKKVKRAFKSKKVKSKKVKEQQGDISR